MGIKFYIGEIKMVDQTKRYIIGTNTAFFDEQYKMFQDVKKIASHVQLKTGLLTYTLKAQFNAELFQMICPIRTVYTFKHSDDAILAVEYLDSIVEVANKLGGII